MAPSRTGGFRQNAQSIEHAACRDAHDQHTLKIAIIAGDGIGKEVIPAGLAAIEAATRGHRRLAPVHRAARGAATTTCSHGRMMDEDGFERLAGVRRHLPRRHRLAGGSRSHRRLGSAAAAAPALPAVRQPPADAPAARARLAAREPHGGRHRHGVRARELRGRVRRARRARSRRHAARGRRTDRPLHPARHRTHPALRVRGRRRSGRAGCSPARPSRTRCATRWCCGTRSRRSCAKDYPAVEYRKYHVDAIAARMVTHPATLDVIVARICSATS